jgi:hypothetical protein
MSCGRSSARVKGQKENVMEAISIIVLMLALATFGVMVAGSISMFRGGRYDALHALPLMEARVITQAIAIALLVIALLFW